MMRVKINNFNFNCQSIFARLCPKNKKLKNSRCTPPARPHTRTHAHIHTTEHRTHSQAGCFQVSFSDLILCAKASQDMNNKFGYPNLRIQICEKRVFQKLSASFENGEKVDKRDAKLFIASKIWTKKTDFEGWGHL